MEADRQEQHQGQGEAGSAASKNRRLASFCRPAKQNVNPRKASVAVGVEEHLLAGRDHVREQIDGLTFQVSANSFFQTNTAQAERLFQLVLEFAELGGGETVLDLYAGTGAISLLLARRCPSNGSVQSDASRRSVQAFDSAGGVADGANPA